MKKIILLALTALIVVGCNNTNDEYTAPYKNGGLNSHLTGAAMCTVIIDSCEYIGTRFQLAHKGNCRFCKERDSIKWEKRKKELEELVIKNK